MKNDNLPAAAISRQPCVPPRFAIVNTCDSPCRRHVAQWVDGRGYFYCARAFEPHLKHYDSMQASRPTSLEDFGFQITVNKAEVIFERIRESTATYEDGKSRRWQDDRWANKFSLPLVKVRPRSSKALGSAPPQADK